MECTNDEMLEYTSYTCKEDVLANFQNGIQMLKDFSFEAFRKKSILVCGGMLGFDKGLSQFLNMWSEKQKNLFLLSEVTAQYRRYTNEKIRFSHICTPHLLAKEIILFEMSIPVSKEMIDLYENKEYIRHAVQNLEERYQRLGDGYAIAWCYYAYEYITELLNRLQPVKVILWNEFYAFHHIFRHLCLEMDIPILYMEFGCLPGTLCIERNGQQGESDPSRKHFEFKYKRINHTEYSDAIQTIKYLRESELNRNMQPALFVNRNILSYYAPNRKVISYIGQNDYESGFRPYTDTTKKYHSPIFQSTLEGLEYLHVLAIKNNWNLVFKPHPTIYALEKEHDFYKQYSSIKVVTEVNINSLLDCSDLIITIFSQVAYIALIREKPVLVLGYNQLRRKGCVYETFTKRKIESTIMKALKYGYTNKQRKRFYTHSAQLLKYYLYDDNVERALRFGQNLKSLVKNIRD